MKQTHPRTIILILGTLGAIGPLSIDMYLPGFATIARDLRTGIAQVGLSLTSYFIGIALGQPLYGPLLDRFGRKRPLVFGLALYVVAALGCALAPSINSLIASRLLLALGGCVGMVASRAVVRDLFPLNETAPVFSTLMLVSCAAPILAPTLGGLILQTAGWRFIFVLLAVITALILAGILWLLPESSGGDPSISLQPLSLVREYARVTREPVFMAYTLASSCYSAGLFAYLSGTPFVFMKLLGLSNARYGLALGCNACGLIAGSQINRLCLRWLRATAITRLANAMQLAAGLLLMLWIIRFGAQPGGIFVLTFVFMFSLGFLFPNSNALAMAPIPTNAAGSASALIGSVQMIAGTVSSALVSVLHNGTAAPMALVMAGCTACGLVMLLTPASKKVVE